MKLSCQSASCIMNWSILIISNLITAAVSCSSISEASVVEIERAGDPSIPTYASGKSISGNIGIPSKQTKSAVAPPAYTLVANISKSCSCECKRVCNGDVSYCSRRYSNITFVGAHDSAFHGSQYDPRVDQSSNLTDQLKAGVRVAEVQVHQKSAWQHILELCHTKCAEKDAGPLEKYLTDLREWLDDNPSEVFTLFIANINDRPAKEFHEVFVAAGLEKYAFVPFSTPNHLDMTEWPIPQEMIDSKMRLVVFMDYWANETEVPYILKQLNYTFSTPYDATDPSFAQCTLYQSSGGSPVGLMYIMNHFLDLSIAKLKIPDSFGVYRKNSATGWGSTGDQAALCASTYGRPPNFILVDMSNLGDAHLAERALNGLSVTL